MVKGRSASIVIGRVIGLIGLAIGLRQIFYGNVDFGWPPYTQFAIGFGLVLLGLAISTREKFSAWMVAVWGAVLLVEAAMRGNLYGPGNTFGAGVIIGNVLAVAYVAVGLYIALRKSPKIQ